MNRQECVDKLNLIYSKIEELEGEAVNEMPNAATKITRELEKIINDIENNGIIEENKTDDE